MLIQLTEDSLRVSFFSYIFE